MSVAWYDLTAQQWHDFSAQDWYDLTAADPGICKVLAVAVSSSATATRSRSVYSGITGVSVMVRAGGSLRVANSPSNRLFSTFVASARGRFYFAPATRAEVTSSASARGQFVWATTSGFVARATTTSNRVIGPLVSPLALVEQAAASGRRSRLLFSPVVKATTSASNHAINRVFWSPKARLTALNAAKARASGHVIGSLMMPLEWEVVAVTGDVVRAVSFCPLIDIDAIAEAQAHALVSINGAPVSWAETATASAIMILNCPLFYSMDKLGIAPSLAADSGLDEFLFVVPTAQVELLIAPAVTSALPMSVLSGGTASGGPEGIFCYPGEVDEAVSEVMAQVTSASTTVPPRSVVNGQGT